MCFTCVETVNIQGHFYEETGIGLKTLLCGSNIDTGKFLCGNRSGSMDTSVCEQSCVGANYVYSIGVSVWG